MITLKIICSIFVIVSILFWMQSTSKDKDFMINDKMLTFLNVDKIIISIYGLATMYLVFALPIEAAVFAAISLPYLIIAAMTDKKTKLVYDTPFYIFGIVAIIIESIMFKEIKASVLLIYLFSQLLATLKMFGRGDRAMSVICGSIYFFVNPELTAIEALLVNCIMIIVAEVTFYIRAIKERNLDGPLKLKESRPLGPDLCLATFITLIGVTVI